VEELRRVSAEPWQDAAELFRRMGFNALISNIDDHPRNHAVIAPNHDWRLSPAYDLTPSSPVSVERRDLAMACGNLGRYWYDIARGCGVSESDGIQIAGAFDYPLPSSSGRSRHGAPVRAIQNTASSVRRWSTGGRPLKGPR
jgi:serine/threonine-protein kinase HipA